MSTLLQSKTRRYAGTATALALSLVLFAPAESRASGYLGGSVGQAGVELTDPAIPTVTFDEEDFAWKAFVGYEWDFSVLSLGVEAGYVDLGAPSGDLAGSIVEVDADGFSGFGTLGFNLGPLGVFAKYGLISWDASLSIDGLDTGSDDGSDPAYGVGAEFGLGPVEVRAEYEVFDIEDTDDISMISVGVVFRF
jgi:hypothetical protein